MVVRLVNGIDSRNFGVIIAFWLPGFVLLWSLSFVFSDVTQFPKLSGAGSSEFGNFLYLTVASLALGMLISAVRFITVEKILCHTCVTQVELDYAALRDPDTYRAFEGTVENHYRYYQYYSNTLVAVVLGCTIYWLRMATNTSVTLAYPEPIAWFITVIAVMALGYGSYDALTKYYQRAGAILNSQKRGEKT